MRRTLQRKKNREEWVKLVTSHEFDWVPVLLSPRAILLPYWPLWPPSKESLSIRNHSNCRGRGNCCRSEHLQGMPATENEPALKKTTMPRREPKGPHSVFSLTVEKQKLPHRAGYMHHGGALTSHCAPSGCHGTHILLWKGKYFQWLSSLHGALIPLLKVSLEDWSQTNWVQ